MNIVLKMVWYRTVLLSLCVIVEELCFKAAPTSKKSSQQITSADLDIETLLVCARKFDRLPENSIAVDDVALLIILLTFA